MALVRSAARATARTTRAAAGRAGATARAGTRTAGAAIGARTGAHSRASTGAGAVIGSARTAATRWRARGVVWRHGRAAGAAGLGARRIGAVIGREAGGGRRGEQAGQQQRSEFARHHGTSPDKGDYLILVLRTETLVPVE